ncbi:MAG: cupredoxin domain-containing protein [Dehalococcoidia bacterium]|nr:cupredoxin domain-containing protein [Dehalococcoidia bacterium]
MRAHFSLQSTNDAPRKGKTLLGMVLLVALGLVGGGGCVPVKANSVAQVSPPVTEYHVEARQFSFAPNEIRVPAGTMVRLVVTSADVDHQLVLTGITPERDTVEGRVQTIEFTAWPPGRYEFGCLTVCGTTHPHMGGSLMVE